ncbi:hypothetical protein NQZ79_g773 [Umbelopsis isabellina]|nr:hypothetical protein NQZ79_g773 [Umbelopsis isabellina]
MINSLFVVNGQGKIIIEKHWRSIISRQIVDIFSDESAKFLAAGPTTVTGSTSEKNSKDATFTKEDVPPIIETSKYLLLHVLRDGLVWLCPVDKEGELAFNFIVGYMFLYLYMLLPVDPLLVFEMIHRIIDILVDYLGDVSEASIRDNFVTVYQVQYGLYMLMSAWVYADILIAAGRGDGLWIPAYN